MRHHRTSTRRRRRLSGRTRAIASLGAVAVLATGLSVKGTFAFWTDSGTAQTGTFTSGTLDITVNGQLAGPANNGGSTLIASLVLTNMTPGESVAGSFPVANAGTVPLTYTTSGTGTGGLAVANGLQYSVTFGTPATAVAANTGTAAAGNRAGTCGGTTATDANTTLLTSPTPTSFPAGGASRSLAVGASDTVCIVARLNSNAPNALQGLSGSAAFLFDAKQVGA